MLITDFGYLLHSFALLEVVKGLGQQVVRVDACLHAKIDALLVDDRRRPLLLVEAAEEDLLEVLLLVVAELGWRGVGLDVHIEKYTLC